ncbi:restriction endonuclease subunit S [Calothrix sp. FACHB-1219]|uniref:restriction endonuclease subunit S n=1 Tax=unclassified Calothrix TaxID=2619626 RepID=UPI001688E81A|nr:MULTISPECIES: restriction endonuclease subunit S [unclassified Calothrix]MBD2207607.1 restriction endonuclease subunit S [Calothrix sp. FACHB-168]MBD2222208.1 restriction endonuclease subunit S [Calothrix sp. FACHB-1219]
MIQLVAIGKVADVNPTIPKELGNLLDNVVTFLPMAAVSEEGRITIPEERPIGEVIKGYRYFEQGDVLLAKITPCMENGKAVFVEDIPHKIGFGSTEFHVLRPSSEIDGRYLFYMLWNPIFRGIAERNMTGTAGQKRVPTDFLKRYKIPLPPLKEQRRIAAILDKADAVRRKRKEAIALTEELLRSAFLDMFGDPITNPKGWEVVNLKSQVAELRYGTSVKCHDVKKNGDLPILRIPNIIGEEISWEDLKYAELEAKETSKLLLKPGDILFVRTNGNPEYIGRCALFEENYGNTLYASYLIRARLKPNAQFYPAFIRDIISFPTYRSHVVREARTTAGNYNINTEGLGHLHLIKPPLKEQESYLQLERNLKIRAEKQKKQLEEINNLFNSLLQKAFRGEL